MLSFWDTNSSVFNYVGITLKKKLQFYYKFPTE